MSRIALFEKSYIFIVAATEKEKSIEALIFELPQYKRGIIVADTEVVHNPGDFLLMNSFRYQDDVTMTLKSDWSNLKILMSVWARKLTLSCVLFAMYQQCYGDIEGDVTQMSLQCQNFHWIIIAQLSLSVFLTKDLFF